MTAPGPLRCRVVSDGRRGIENQALGLAEAVGRLTPLTIETLVAARPDWLGRSPPVADNAALACDVWVGCGRAAVAAAPRHRRAAPNAAFVYVQDPKRRYELFDLVLAPEHDAVARPNVVATLGSLNRITDAVLADARDQFAAFEALPRPRVAVLIGGDSKRHRMSPPITTALLDQLDALAQAGAGLMITTSRRTPPAAVSAMCERFGSAPTAHVWTGDEDGPNPYFGMLAHAELAVVTQDSTNMITEAASAGLPVLLAKLDGADGKFADLYGALTARGAARWFDGTLDIWPVEPLRETERAARAVNQLLASRT